MNTFKGKLNKKDVEILVEERWEAERQVYINDIIKEVGYLASVDRACSYLKSCEKFKFEGSFNRIRETLNAVEKLIYLKMEENDLAHKDGSF